MRVLGIDIGLKRTGLALSDETGIAIRLLPNLIAKTRVLALEKIMSLISEFSVEAVVIGTPEPKTKGSSAIAKRAIGLKSTLDEIISLQGLGITTYLWDEEMTSKKALANLVAANAPKKKRNSMLDAASAAVLVEEFLYFARSGLDEK
jgi:putative holliday junction resolvase